MEDHRALTLRFGAHGANFGFDTWGANRNAGVPPPASQQGSGAAAPSPARHSTSTYGFPVQSGWYDTVNLRQCEPSRRAP
jgi:hypothetical protein